MAQTGYTPIQLYYSANANATPTAGNLADGELALNTADGKLFYKDSGGTVQVIASTASANSVSNISFGTTGLTPNTSTSGSVTVAGTLALTNGGTGATSAPAANAALTGYTATATAGGTTTLTNASSYYQIFTGTTTQTVQLPVTSTLTTGWSFHIVNNSTGNLTVNSSGGNLVITVLPGTTVMATCIGTTLTTAADWEAGYTDFSTATGTGSVVLGSSPTLSNATFTGFIETIPANVTSTTAALTPTTGTLQIYALTGNSTPTAGTWAAGQSLTLHIDDGTAYTITWTDSSFGTGGVKWVSGTAPVLATSGYTVVELWKVGTQVYGALVGTVV